MIDSFWYIDWLIDWLIDSIYLFSPLLTMYNIEKAYAEYNNTDYGKHISENKIMLVKWKSLQNQTTY